MELQLYTYKAMVTSVFVIARYSMGMANIEQDEVEAKNKNVELTLGIGF